MNPYDITGKRYGKLVAIKIADEKFQNKKGRIWDFKCDCGNTHQAKVAYVEAGRVKSCGCLPNQEKINRPHDLFPHSYWMRLQSKLETRNLVFEVSAEYLAALWENQQGVCALSGEKISLPKISKDVRFSKYTASLDRIDSNKGYIVDNVQWVHKKVNMMKSNMSDAELTLWCDKISTYMKNKNKIS